MKKIIEIRQDDAKKTKMLFYYMLLISILSLYYLHDSITQYLSFCGAVWSVFFLRLLSIKLKSRSDTSNAPVIIMDSEGLLDKRMKVGKILWADIERVYARKIKAQTFICIETTRDDFYLGRRGGLKDEMLLFNPVGMSALTIRTNFLDVEHRDVLLSIVKRQQAAIKGDI